MKTYLLFGLLAAAAASLFVGCRAVTPARSGAGNTPGYTQITQEQAKKMMVQNDGHLIVDVRRQDEYDGGHIPGAICVPNESIADERPAALPDPDQILLVYCRSGRRSKEAAAKLAALGYTHVYEFGGILDWTGEITADEAADAADAAKRPRPILVIDTGNGVFYATLEDNDSARAFIEKLEPDVLQLEMHDYGNFEKVGALPWSLPTCDEQITTEPGDVILYQGDHITIYYDRNTWRFTRLAKIGGATKEALLAALGEGGATVTFSLEWSE